MKHFLLIYDRARAELSEKPTVFEDVAAATRARNTRELVELANPNIEVVVIGSPTLDDLMRTHARYFYSADALLRSAS